jgi:5-methylcytosine-specific restriction endonuclease McrA
MERSKAYRDYMSSMQWWAKKGEAIERAGHKCERCGATESLEVHHLTYDQLGDERPEDLLVVCPDCHRIEDEKRLVRTASKRWWARVDGWASKRYGEDWDMWRDEGEVEEEFERWLEHHEDDYY